MKLSSTLFAATAVCSSVSAFTAPKGNVLQRSSATPHPSTSRYQPASSITALKMSQEEMELITMDANERMDKTLSNLAENLTTIRTGRANPNMLDRVEADYYGAMTPINQMATISVPSSQQLQISPFDKSSLTDIEKAIIYAGLGFTPTNDGNVIRINIPTLTEERRQELLKQCKSIGEEAKVAVRNIRRDGVDSIKKMEKAGDLGKDQALDGQDEIQKMTDDHIKLVDDAIAKKEKEVMTL
jgi:ribosome recycling factor